MFITSLLQILRVNKFQKSGHYLMKLRIFAVLIYWTTFVSHWHCMNKCVYHCHYSYTVCTGCRNCDGKYANWVDQAPGPHLQDLECVYIRKSGRWDVSDCSARKRFICEFSEISMFLS